MMATLMWLLLNELRQKLIKAHFDILVYCSLWEYDSTPRLLWDDTTFSVRRLSYCNMLFFLCFCFVFNSPLETIHLGSLYDHLLVWGIILVCDYNEVILGWVGCKSLGDLSAAPWAGSAKVTVIF